MGKRSPGKRRTKFDKEKCNKKSLVRDWKRTNMELEGQTSQKESKV